MMMSAMPFAAVLGAAVVNDARDYYHLERAKFHPWILWKSLTLLLCLFIVVVAPFHHVWQFFLEPNGFES
jgi:hypothetical protein